MRANPGLIIRRRTINRRWRRSKKIVKKGKKLLSRINKLSQSDRVIPHLILHLAGGFRMASKWPLCAFAAAAKGKEPQGDETKSNDDRRLCFRRNAASRRIVESGGGALRRGRRPSRFGNRRPFRAEPRAGAQKTGGPRVELGGLSRARRFVRPSARRRAPRRTHSARTWRNSQRTSPPVFAPARHSAKARARSRAD